MFYNNLKELPIKYYSNKDFDNAINTIVTDMFDFTGVSGQNQNKNSCSYILKEKDNNIIFQCLASSIEKEMLEISFKNKMLLVETKDNPKDLPFFRSLNYSLKLKKEINSDSSFASLKNGVLTVTMPLKEDQKEKKIRFK